MAGPLHWFRKNQKLLLGVFGVLLMFAFTISLGSGIDPIIDYLSGGGVSRGGGEDAVVVSWSDGQLRESDFHNARVRRNLMSSFLTQITTRAAARNAQPRVGMLPRVDSDEALLELLILIREAEGHGIVVSDDAIVQYLVNLSDETMQPIEFLEIWKTVTGGQGTEGQLFDMLRRELAAQQMRSMTQNGVYPSSPIAEWDLFNRLERRVEVELLPIPVEEFVDQVRDPSDEEIQEFYEKHKNDYDDPNLPDPGFKQREKKAFHYVKLNYEDFFAFEQQHVPDEEVQAYYQEHREEFRDTSLPEADLEVEAIQSADAADNENATGDKGAAQPAPSSSDEDLGLGKPVDDAEMDASASEAQPDSNDASVDDQDLPAAESEPKDPDAIDEGTIEEDTSAPADISDVQQSEDASDDTDTAEDESSDNDAPEPSLTPIPQATQEDLTPSDTPEDSGADSRGPSTTAENQLQTGPPATEDPAIDGDVATRDTITIDTATADTATADTATADTATADTATADTATADTAGGDAADGEVRYKPLEKVADEIRDSIARRRAQEKFDRAVSKAQSRADRYYRDHVAYQIARDKGMDAEEPLPPDFSDLDDNLSFTLQTVGLSDRFEVQEYDLGKSFQFYERPQGGFGQFQFVDFAYGETLPLRKAQLFPGGPALEKFVFWITETSDAQVPELDEIRDQVVAGWKRKEALGLAREVAGKEAQKAREGQSLAAVCNTAGREIIETGPISWMTAGNVPQTGFTVPRPTIIPGVPTAGSTFSEDVFRLKAGEVGVTVDAPEKIVFVARVVEAPPRLEVRQEEFLQRGGEPYRFYFQKRRANELYRFAWYEDLLEQYGVSWKREPRTGSR